MFFLCVCLKIWKRYFADEISIDANVQNSKNKKITGHSVAACDCDSDSNIKNKQQQKDNTWFSAHENCFVATNKQINNWNENINSFYIDFSSSFDWDFV